MRQARLLWYLLVILMIGNCCLMAAPLVEKGQFPSELISPKTTAASPNWQIAVHKINKLWLAITNGATFGIGFAGSELDPETNLPAPSCEYPANSDITYLYIGAMWAGAVVGRDTLVSVGFDGNYFVREFWPQPGEEGAIIRKSNMKTSLDYYTDAVSEQDFICSYTDTITDPSVAATDGYDGRPHVPLGLEVKQRSYGWSYDYAEDFIIFDYTIRNINRFPLKKIYFGIYVDADVYHTSAEGSGWGDDICGYVHSVPSSDISCYQDTIRVAWTADNDGDPNSNAGNVFDFTSATSVTGTAVLRSPNPDMEYSFNWWVASGTPALDWGPRQTGSNEKPFRDFGTGMGSPNGDRNKYYIMSSNEFDYDQLESATSHTGNGFLPPTREAEDIANGYDARYLFSFGPFDLAPGDTLPLTLAYVAGENFHVEGPDFERYWDPMMPHMYQDRLSFADLGVNAKWAHWIFDNPGVDTDGDRDSGKFIWVCQSGGMDVCFGEDELLPDSSLTGCKKVYIAGDGVPDFRGASPPPAPVLDIIPEFGLLRIRWNGQISERNVDIFSGTRDFEGYRVYYGEDNRIFDYTLIAGYDVDDFNMYTWDPTLQRWNISDAPLPRDSVEAL
ncbi:MAG: hypothetical protein PHR28_10065, partial [candidate division Zixibacteria bacterium]|nr:hypothetical protein [candidate division Zixibacteria bacterium]